MEQNEGVKKAAVLLISLGSEVSAQVMKQLPDDYIQKISYEIANTDYVKPERRDQVLDEFINTANGRQYILDGGYDYAKSVLNQGLGPQKAKEILDVLKQLQMRERPFDIARTADLQQLVNVLIDEHPQVIALVLCYMQPEKGAALLAQLPRDLQVDVAERVGLITTTSPEVIKRIEESLEAQLSNFEVADTENVGGVSVLVGILNAASRSTEKNILGDLEERQPELATEIKTSLFTFDDITSLSDMDVQKVLRAIDNEALKLALKGAAADIKEFIFKNLSQRAAETIQEELEFMGPTRLATIEEAQQKVVAEIRRLDDNGEIYIERGNTDGMVK
ncbi:flagellar motor switch protein FliG [Periweissella ghanensis]|uniref:Flagellar motor switch protein FliG n=1 Tax=Periweissella ghanensis TaxID=467997 RepID=A0ABM8Z9I3_9LACO|nr:flagellar motor switch protein FliG [Periweissella ghanensis]MCM0601036.1 flagellar motor switch protein FliG [Periweissella ghanensis]CAH0417883.1 Flagellar motor switch protein FliG [Periweissella ghanensis]